MQLTFAAAVGRSFLVSDLLNGNFAAPYQPQPYAFLTMSLGRGVSVAVTSGVTWIVWVAQSHGPG